MISDKKLLVLFGNISFVCGVVLTHYLLIESCFSEVNILPKTAVVLYGFSFFVTWLIKELSGND